MEDNNFNRYQRLPDWKKYIPLVRYLFFGIVLVILLWMTFFQVRPEEVGVITRFGRYIRQEESGLHLKIPVLERVYKVAVERQNKEEFGFRTISSGIQSQYTKKGTADESLMLSGDLNLADVEWVVQYRISDAYKFLFTVREPVTTMRDISEACMRQIVGDRTVNEVLTVGRIEIATSVLEEIQKLCTEYSLGIKIEQVVLQDVNPPDPVKDAFNAVIQAPEVTKRRLYLETMASVIPKIGNKIIMDEEGSNVLPLLQMQMKNK